MKRQERKYQGLKPTTREWLMAVISTIFVAGGIFILPKNQNVGIVTIAFFGLCLIVAVSTLWGKVRESKFTGQSVTVIGGLEIRPSRLRLLLISLLLLLLGLILAVFGGNYPLVFRVISYFILVAGTALVVLIFLKKIPAGFFRFDPEGFVIGRKWGAIRIPWSEIAEIRVGDFNSNSAVFLWVKSPESLEVVPKNFLARAMKDIMSNERWVGAHFMILTAKYGLPSPMLAEAIERYRSDISAREELRVKYLA